MQSARRKTKKTLPTRLKPDELLTISGQVEVLSRRSPSPLIDIYQTEQFKGEWENDVRFHVARNLLYLRRFRGKSQALVGKLMGTSQSAVARIESGRENLTFDTLQRYLTALGGRFYVSIHPDSFSFDRPQPWWELVSNPGIGRWKVVKLAVRRTNTSVRL